MKRFLIVVGLLLPLHGFSQSSVDRKQQELLGQGKLNVGITVGHSFSGNTGAITQATPRIQYFLTDGWSISAEGRYSKAGEDFTYVGAGLSTRYYFLRRTRFALFGQVGGTYGKSTYSKIEPTDPTRPLSSLAANSYQVNAGLGTHYRLGKRWSLEFTVERSKFQKLYLIPDYNSWQGNFSINYCLN